MKQFLDIDPASAVPIWRQIEDGVRRLVVSGRLAPGSAVPSVRELSRTLRVNPATVSKAYQLLTTARLLDVRRGEGTFVAELDDERLAAERRDLLADGATTFAGLARDLGATREETLEILNTSLNLSTEGGREGDG